MLGIIDRLMIRLYNKKPTSNEKDLKCSRYFLEQSGDVTLIYFLPKSVNLQTMKKLGLIPGDGDVLIYGIPDSFLASSPNIVMEAFCNLEKDFISQYKKLDLVNKRIRFLGLSIGTMPAFYFANKMKCEKVVAVCPTDKLGNGIFSTLAASKLKIKDAVIKNGYDAGKYDEIIRSINPMNNIENLPQNVEIYLARFDNYVPFQGGKRLVDNIKKYNKDIKVKQFNLVGHVMTMIIFGFCNKSWLRKGGYID